MVFEREGYERPVFGRTMVVHEAMAQWRYASMDDAIAGHDAVVRRFTKFEQEALGLLHRRGGTTQEKNGNGNQS
jgi:hypothetical protein